MALECPQFLIAETESIFKNRIKKIVEYVKKNEENYKIILITGPSSSGKTTFSKILREELRNLGIWNDIISLDNFYKGIDSIPVLADGSRDFESIDCIDVTAIQQVIFNLLKNGNCDIPLYNFQTKSPSEQKIHIEVPKNGIVIIEGIHAISPKITDGILLHNVLKIYIDVENSVKNNVNENFILPEDTRLMRRIVRDYKHRFTSPIDTLDMWKNVKRGEKFYIKPLKKFADLTIDSFHNYEFCTMKHDILMCFDQIIDDLHISLLKEKIAMFKSIPKDFVPQTSLLREFI